jgi:AcrR family transcriptional regulator
MGLRPEPVQTRGVATVRSAIDAAIELLDEQDGDRLRLTDVTARSGVSNGSLIHHFGTRDGLVAAALATRFDREATDRVRQFDGLAVSPDGVAPALAQLLVGTGQRERAAARRARFRALSFARDQPELRIALAESFRTLEREMGLGLLRGQGGEVLVDGVSSTALAVFAETYAAGRLLDGALVEPLPETEWDGLFLAVLGAVVTPSVIGRIRASGRIMVTDVPPHPRFVRPAIPTLALSGDERSVLDHAAAHLRTAGESTLLVRDVCIAAGVTRGWFSRHFAGREELIDLARIDALIAISRGEVAVLEHAFDGASTVDELQAAFAALAVESDGPVLLGSAWQRLDVLVAASGRARFTEDAGGIVRAALARVADAIAGAQQRGLVRQDLSARAIARFLWGYPLAVLLGAVVDAKREELHALAERTFAMLTTDVTR